MPKSTRVDSRGSPRGEVDPNLCLGLEHFFAVACREGVRQTVLDSESVAFLRSLARRLGIASPRASQILRRTVKLRQLGRIPGNRPLTGHRIAQRARQMVLQKGGARPENTSRLEVFLSALERCPCPSQSKAKATDKAKAKATVPRKFEQYPIAPAQTSRSGAQLQATTMATSRASSSRSRWPSFAGGVAAGALSIWIPFLFFRSWMG